MLCTEFSHRLTSPCRQSRLANLIFILFVSSRQASKMIKFNNFKTHTNFNDLHVQVSTDKSRSSVLLYDSLLLLSFIYVLIYPRQRGEERRDCRYSFSLSNYPQLYRVSQSVSQSVSFP